MFTLFNVIQRGICLKEVANELYKQRAINAEVVIVLCCTGTTTESAEHWVLGVISKEEEATFVMDSIEDSKCRNKVFKCLAIVLRMMYDIEGLSVPDSWRNVYCDDCAIQRNNYDCGLYVVLYVYSILQGKKPPRPERDANFKSVDGRRWIYTHLVKYHARAEVSRTQRTTRRVDIPPGKAGFVLNNAINMHNSYSVEGIVAEKSNKIIRRLLHSRKKNL